MIYVDDDYFGYRTGSDELWKYGSFEDIMTDDRIDEKFFAKKPKPRIKPKDIFIKKPYGFLTYVHGFKRFLLIHYLPFRY